MMGVGYLPYPTRRGSKPSISSPLHSPDVGPSSPRTPQHQTSLPRVDEDASHERTTTGGSRAPLVARDYVEEYPSPHAPPTPEDDRHDLGSFVIISDRSSTASPRPIPAPPRESEPLVIPPRSVHDAYLSSYFQSLDPAPTEPNSPLRPAPLIRANTAPGVPAQPPPTTETPDPLPSPAAAKSGTESKPIFSIFDAELDSNGTGIVKALKTHLDGVLRIQEEVGRMHLALEGMGLDDATEVGEDTLKRRERGVDEIMQRLDTLSEDLRTYHSLGTPKLAFPQPARDASQSASRQLPAQGDSTRQPPAATPRASTQAQVMDGPARNATFSPGFGEYLPGAQPEAKPAVSSAPSKQLSPLSFDMGRRGSLTGVEDKAPMWFERKVRESHEGYDSDRGAVTRRDRTFTQSPMEMADRSRPW